MGAIASLITSLTIVYSTVDSYADQRKYQIPVSQAFLWGIHRGPVNTPHKWPVTRKMFPFDDVIMSYPTRRPQEKRCLNNDDNPIINISFLLKPSLLKSEHNDGRFSDDTFKCNVSKDLPEYRCLYQLRPPGTTSRSGLYSERAFGVYIELDMWIQADIRLITWLRCHTRVCAYELWYASYHLPRSDLRRCQFIDKSCLKIIVIHSSYTDMIRKCFSSFVVVPLHCLV